MSEYQDALLRLEAMETYQPNTIPSYMPSNGTKNPTDIKKLMKHELKRQPNTYSIDQILNIEFMPEDLPDQLKHNYYNVQPKFKTADQRLPHRNHRYAVGETRETGMQEKYDRNKPNLDHYYGLKWHFVLNPDFTGVQCNARYIKVEKINITMVDPHIKQWQDEIKERRDYITNINIELGSQTRLNLIRQRYLVHLLNNHIPPNPNPQQFFNNMKYWIKTQWENEIRTRENQIRSIITKTITVNGSFSPYLRIGNLDEPKGIDTLFPYMMNQNIEIWFSDQYNTIIDCEKYDIKGQIHLKLIVENRN